MSDANGARGMKLLAGNANRSLAEAIAQHLKLPFEAAESINRPDVRHALELIRYLVIS